MTDQSKEIETGDIEEPAFYKESTLNLISSVSLWGSWLVLLVFVAMTITSYNGLMVLAQGTPLSEIIANPNAQTYIFTNIAIPFFTGLVFFILLQAVSLGLNVLYEIELGMRMAEAK